MANKTFNWIANDQSVIPLVAVDISGNGTAYALGTVPVDSAGATALVAEDAAHVSGQRGSLVMGVRKDTVVSLEDADGDNAVFVFGSDGRLYVRTANIDHTNNVAKSQPKSALGSGGLLTASGIAHTGAGTMLGGFFYATTDAVWDLYDNTAASGTKFATFSILAKTTLPIPPSGLAFGTGVYANLVSGTGGGVVYVGPAVQ